MTYCTVTLEACSTGGLREKSLFFAAKLTRPDHLMPESTSTSAPSPGKRVTTRTLQKMRDDGESISMLTAYDYPTAEVLDEAGVDIFAGRRLTGNGGPRPRDDSAGNDGPNDLSRRNGGSGNPSRFRRR